MAFLPLPRSRFVSAIRIVEDQKVNRQQPSGSI
jgi:hypothetical protein